MTQSLKTNFSFACAAALLSSGVLGSVIAFAGAAHAQSAAKGVTLSSEAMIERITTDASGKETIGLKEPKDVVVTPGDKVVFTLKYKNEGSDPAVGFRATNPMPAAIQFIEVQEEWAEVSVDGGKNWGKLTALSVTNKSSDGSADVTRPASAQDVTHVRWVFAQPIAVGAQGSVSYRGVVK